MQNITGQPVVGDDLYGRSYELETLWERLESGEHVPLLAQRRVGNTSLMLELQRCHIRNWQAQEAETMDITKALSGNCGGIGTPHDLREHLLKFEACDVDQVTLIQQAGRNTTPKK